MDTAMTDIASDTSFTADSEVEEEEFTDLHKDEPETSASKRSSCAGYLYAVAAGCNFAATKLGRTNVKDPEIGLTNRYQTSLVPLNVISMIPVVDTISAESLMKVYFARRRLEVQHEVFDMSTKEGRFDHEAWQGFAAILQQVNEANGGPLPEPVEFVRARREAAKEARRRERQTILNVQRREDLATKEAAREAAKAERKRDKEARDQEIKVRRDQEKQSRMEAQLKLISRFVDKHCIVGAPHKMSTTTFKIALEAANIAAIAYGDTGEGRNRCEIKHCMHLQGFAYKKSRGHYFFTGVAMLKSQSAV